MIHGVIQNGTILPVDPLPADWGNGREVVIEAVDRHDNESAVQKWFDHLKELGPALYEPGERELIERVMAEADHEAKEHVRQSWMQF